MRFLLLLAVLLACSAAYAGCERRHLAVDGIERGGIVCMAEDEGRAQKRPVILAFHGRGSNAAEMAAATGLHLEWPQAIVVYLDGMTGNPAPYDPRGERAGWEINPGDLGDRDVRFVDAVLAQLNAHYRIDSERIYAVGHSNGARFVGILWMLRASRFAAFAFSAAQADTLLEKAEPRSAFLGMGEKDELVPFAWQVRSIGYARKLLGIETGAAPVVEGVHVESGKEGRELLTYVHSDGHVWPQGQTRMIVDFFKRNPLHGALAVRADHSSQSGRAAF